MNEQGEKKVQQTEPKVTVIQTVFQFISGSLGPLIPVFARFLINPCYIPLNPDQFGADMDCNNVPSMNGLTEILHEFCLLRPVSLANLLRDCRSISRYVIGD